MSSPMDKIMNLIDKLPEADRAVIAGTYYAKPEKELSSKVTKLKKVFDKLDQEEQCDFVKLIGARKMDTWSGWKWMGEGMWMGIEIISEAVKETDDKDEDDLDSNKE